jgi:regulator of protease activity HflC (stomatin/prohibitin superfamily)
MSIKRIILSGMVFCFLIFCVASCKTIDPGYVGIKINYYGDDKGVSSYPVVTGRQFYNPFTTRILEYPSFIQTVNFRNKQNDNDIDESLMFSSKPGTRFNTEVFVSYHLIPDKIPNFYIKFRNDDLTIFSHSFLRNIVRDSFAEESVRYDDEELYATLKEEFLHKAKLRITERMLEYGVTVDQVGFLTGPNPPKSVEQSINEKAEAIQLAIKTENQLRHVKAEADKVIAEAEGRAKANRLLNDSTTPQILEWKRMDLQEKALSKWDGKLPQTMIPGSSLPMIGVNK